MFLGTACRPQSGSEPAEGRISFDRWRLQFHSPTLSLELPLHSLQVTLDAAAGDRICFSNPARPGEAVYTYDLGILDHPALRGRTEAHAQLQNRQAYAELKRRVKLTVFFLAGFAVLVMVVSSLLGVMVRALAARVPPEFERKLGLEALADLQEEHRFIGDPRLLARLTNAVAPVVAVVADRTRHYHFYIIEEPSPNAFALPGGQVVVTTGMMDLAQKPQELAAVVAHEIAHLTQRHVFRKIISSAGPYLVFTLFVGEKGGVLSLLGGSTGLLVRQSFSQTYELEADSVGWDYLVAAKIDPRYAAAMLRKIEDTESHGLGDLEPAAFSSHPQTEKRIQRLETKWRNFKGKSAFERAGKSE